MAVTILEALQNAKANLIDNAHSDLAQLFGINQLKNAVTLLEKGYNLDDEVEPLLMRNGSIIDVPNKKEKVILDKSYEGFESTSDISRDLYEMWDKRFNPAVKDIPGEFEGTVRIVVTYTEEIL